MRPAGLVVEVGKHSPLGRRALGELRRCWAASRHTPTGEASWSTWTRHVEPLLGTSPSEDLFVRHAYLATVARLVAWSVLEPTRSPNHAVAAVTRRAPFAGHGLPDLDDVADFPWLRLGAVVRAMRPIWNAIAERMAAHHVPADGIDVFAPLVEDVVSAEERHEGGEHYTPSWLACRTVAAVAPRPGERVVDPACGTGTFLRAVVARRRSGDAKAKLACIEGWDLHPLAVLLARVNLLLAIAPHLDADGSPVRLPVHLRDGLGEHTGEPFDKVIGNPPWVAFRALSQSRRERVDALARRYGLVLPGRLRTHLELAVVFLLHMLGAVLRPGGRGAFVLPRSLLTAAHYDAIRRGEHQAQGRIEALWDLREVTGLFPVPASVAFFTRTARRTEQRTSIPGRRWSCERSVRGSALVERPCRFALRRLGAWSSWSSDEGPGLQHPRAPGPSPYRHRFRQGATLVPRNCWFVEVTRRFDASGDLRIAARTDPEAARLAKAPYRDHRMSGVVEAVFARQAVLSRHLFPFVAAPLADVILPVDPEPSARRLLDATSLRQRGYPGMAAWMAAVEKLFAEIPPRRAGRGPLERLDYHGELLAQPISPTHLVLYNGSGTHLAAVVVPPRAPPPVIDAKVYWMATQSAEEAAYLAAVLNAARVDRLVKPFQSVGQQGERDFHKKVLELPIPAFCARDPLHRRISVLGARCARRAAEMGPLPSRPLGPTALGRHRRSIRLALARELEAIDALVGDLLGASC